MADHTGFESIFDGSTLTGWDGDPAFWRAANGALIVRYSENKPAAGTVSAQILTFPFHLVAIPKAAVTDVKFEKVAK